MDNRRLERHAFFERNRLTLETAYLASMDPRAQSGFRGDEARWERARRVIVEAIDADGAFLDVGCANGHLMDSVTQWASAKGLSVEPYGLDFSASLVALARERLPQWADRIHFGNVFDWEPPRRFRFVRTELVYVPVDDRRALVERLLAMFIEPGGRLIVAAYASRGVPPEDVRAVLAGFGYQAEADAESRDLDGTLLTRVSWLRRGASRGAGEPVEGACLVPGQAGRTELRARADP